MTKINTPFFLLLAALLFGLTLTACGDDTTSDDDDNAAGDGDGDSVVAGDGDGDAPAETFECDTTSCEGLEVMGFALDACCISADMCGIDASLLQMGCLPTSALEQIPGEEDAGM